jgi:2-succinyl-6-hydroxy-2,4-cyclohexadiene-1-carboxylate synthase
MRQRAPLLLLHGFLGAPQSFEPLALSDREVFAPVLLGHTGTELPRGALAAPLPEAPLEVPDGPAPDWGLVHGGFEREVDRLAAWARSQHAGPFALCGYSLGARLGLGLLVRHPDLCASALLVSVHPGLASSRARGERLAQDLERCRALRERGVARFVERWERLPLFANQASLPEPIRARQRAVRTVHSALGLVQSLLHTGLASMPNYRPSLEQLRVPLTLVTGMLDPKFEALARNLCAQHTAIRWHSVAQAGHNPILERPSDVAELLD